MSEKEIENNQQIRKFTLNLPKSLFVKLKIESAKTDKTMTDLTIEALEKLLKNK